MKLTRKQINRFLLLVTTMTAVNLHGFSQPVIPAPAQTDQIIIDAGTPGSADPNDRIRYTVTINNSGTSPATLVQLHAVLDARTTLVAGSFKTSPLAFDDAYVSIGNVGINVPAANGLLANDYDDNIPGLTATAGTFTTTQSGTIIIAADGSFTYNPPAGYEGADTYTYTLNDGNGVGGGVPATNTGIITITMTGMIWFINNNAGACASTCNGRLNNPFTTLAAFQAVNNGTGNNPATGDNIFIYESATSYIGGVTLLNTQKLIGQDATATLLSITGLSLPTFSNALPVMNSGNGTFTTITGSNAGGDDITVASGNTIRGLTAGNATDFAIDDGGATVGTLTVLDVTINNTTGGGFRTANGGTLAVTINSLTSTGGTNGINLTGMAGSFTGSGGTITNPTGTGALISGGSVTFSHSGAITDNTGFAVDVDNHDSNNVTFSGNITSTGTGIRVQNCGGGTKTFSGASKSLNTGTNSGVTLTNNAGATITISGGGLVISTTSGTGFNATGGATAINVTGTGNTITSGTGTALNVVSTTIGVSNLNFLSISANGGANGIVLNTTGSVGGLTVTGNNNAAVGGDNSGGTIQNLTGVGISMLTTMNPSFTNMNIQNTADSGIKGNNVTNFTYKNGTINNSGTGLGAETANIAFYTTGPLGTESFLTGAVNITNNILTTAYYHGIDIFNFNGTISNANLSGNTITSSNSNITSKGNGIRLIAFGSATTIANVTKANIDNNIVSNFPSGAGIMAQGGNGNAAGPAGIFGTAGSGTNIISITGNTVKGFSAANRIGTQAIVTSVNGKGQGNFNISNNGTIANPITNTIGTTIAVASFGFANVTATVNQNVIVSNNSVGSQGIGVGTGQTLTNTETPTLTITLNNNNISQTDGNGILAVARDDAGQLNVTIKNNTVAAPLSGNRNGIRIDAGNGISTDDAVCLDITGNTSAGSGLSPEGIGIRKQGTVSTTNDFGIEGMVATASPGVEAYVAGLNPGSSMGVLLISATSGFSNCSSAP